MVVRQNREFSQISYD